VLQDFLKRLFLEFDSQRSNWLRAVKTISEIDCLCSLACASNEMDEPKCRPEFVEEEGGDEGEAFIDFTDLRHPAMALTRDFIPNDVQMGGGKARTVLLTGPNMVSWKSIPIF
jgi:DNA mismatch repair protein MSH6